MHVLMYQVIVGLILTVLAVIIILGVRMVEEIARAKQALLDINTTIAGLPVGIDHTSEIKEIADGIVAADQALKDKFPA